MDLRNRLESRMMSYVKGAIRDADAVVAIVDASDREASESVLAMVQPPADKDDQPPMLVVLNKDDLLDEQQKVEVEVRNG
jgi:GTPase Era involved in 16S rRNA processing